MDLIVVTAAMESEIAFLRKAICRPGHAEDRLVEGIIDSKKIILLRTGVGPLKTSQRLIELANSHSPQHIISIGCAGSLDPKVKTGDVVISKRLIDDEDGSAYSPSSALVELAVKCCETLGFSFHVGDTVSTYHVAATPDEKRNLAARHDAVAVDMESAHVASWAKSTGTSMLSIRTVSDSLEDRIPPELAAIVDETGKLRLFKAVRSFAGKPTLLLELMRLKANFDQSICNLEKAVLLLLKSM